MLEPSNNNQLPPIPGKRYFAIGEVSELCAVKPHVLRYWEQEFPSLSPVKRRGNRRYYQRQDVVLHLVEHEVGEGGGAGLGHAAADVNRGEHVEAATMILG